MKRIFILIGMVAVSLFCGCQKEVVSTSSSNEVVLTGRVITATLEGVKTGIDSGSAKWISSDQIWISDGTNNAKVIFSGTPASGETLGVILDDGSKFAFSVPESFSEGDVYAVHPYAAAAEVSEGNIKVNIPEIQDGSYACANICVAKGSTAFSFRNVASVLKLSQTSSEVKEIKLIVEDAKASAIAGPATVTYGDVPTVEFTGTAKTITVKNSNGTALPADCYIAVAPVKLAAGMPFSYDKGEAIGLGGKNLTAEKTLAVNKLYDLGSMDEGIQYHPYTLIGGKKWAKYNIGVDETSLTSSNAWNGQLFSYGNVEGQSGNSFTPPFSEAAYNGTGDGVSEPTLGSKISKQADWNINIHDAARHNWGGAWRVPTIYSSSRNSDSWNLFKSCYCEWTTSYNDIKDLKGYIVYAAKNDNDKLIFKCSDGKYYTKYSDKADGMLEKSDFVLTGTYSLSDVHIFLPASGNSNLASRSNVGVGGYFWGSSYRGTADEYSMTYNKDSLNPSNTSCKRWNGRTIRPVAD